MYTLVHKCDASVDVSTWCIFSSMCYVRTRLTFIRIGGRVESVFFDRFDTLVSSCRCVGITNTGGMDLRGWGQFDY